MTILKQRYKLKQKLAQGEAITTWLAEDTQTQSTCVVKGLSLQQTDAWKTLELFEREAKILANLKHPNIPTFIDSFQDKDTAEGTFYLVQEYIQGQNLQQSIEDGRFFTEKEVIQMAKSLLKTLDYLHQFSPPIIHRDIKPSNIVMAETGQFYLIDFGAVREKIQDTKQTKTIVGTFGYMPIEQFEGKASAASDIYSLGLTLIFVLSHQDPTAMDKQEMLLQFRPHVNISESLAQLLEKMIAPDAHKRYQKVTEVLQALEELNQKPAAPKTKTPTVASKSSVPFSWGKAIGITVVALIGLGYCQAVKKRTAPETRVSDVSASTVTAKPFWSSHPTATTAPVNHSRENLMAKADVLWGKSDYINALSAYTTVLEKDPGSYKAYFRRAFCYGKQFQYPQAIADAKKVLELAPATDKSYVPYALYNIAWYYSKIDQHQTAVEWFTRSLQNTTEPEDVYNMRGLSYIELKRLDLAEKDFLDTIKADPKNRYPYNNLGYVAELRGQFDKAISYYDRAIAMDPKYALPHFNKADIYRKRKQSDLAIQEYSNAISFSENYPTAYLQRGILYQQQRQYDLALKDFNSTLKYDTKSAAAYWHRGQIHRLQKNCGLAQADFKQACQMGTPAACQSSCP